MQVVVAVVLVGLAIYLYYLSIKWFFINLAPFIFGAGAVFMSGAVLVNYLRAMSGTLFTGGGWADSPDGPEPAFRQYFFRKAFQDYACIVRDSYKANIGAAERVIKLGTKLFLNPAWLATWPLGVTFYAIVATGAVVAGCAYVAFGTVHLLLVILFCAVALAAAVFFRVLEYGSMIWRRIFLVCPNSGCYRRISLPIYLCPNCGAEHERLVPGTYGTFRRRCQCGQKLPTLFLFGRNKLPAICPHEACRRPLSAAVGTKRNLHVPVVGGPAAGKTSFLMANMVELHGCAANGEVSLSFPETKDEKLFDACRRAFGSGTVLRKTAEFSPDAFLVNLADGRGKGALLYVYDAAGELYQDTEVLRGHEYYSYTHAILFLVDPFSLQRVQIDYQSSLRGASDAIKPCAERPQDIYDRMIGTLRESSKMGRRFKNQPVAVVVTKVDAFDLASKMRVATSRRRDGTGQESQSVRQWLMDHGEGNLVRSIEHDFKNVRYFCCSALGRMPDGNGAPFRPAGVLDPLSWALDGYGIALADAAQRRRLGAR
jgi:hypothetical protein